MPPSLPQLGGQPARSQPRRRHAPRAQVKELLMEFYRGTKGKKPEALVFYRDGVSEGQFQQVLQASARCAASLRRAGIPTLRLSRACAPRRQQQRQHARPSVGSSDGAPVPTPGGG